MKNEMERESKTRESIKKICKKCIYRKITKKWNKREMKVGEVKK